jgi:hypothetical protein
LDWSRRSPAAARLADRWAAMEAIVGEMGNTKFFTIKESMVPRAAALCTRSFIGHKGSREVSSTGAHRLDCLSFGLKWSDPANWLTWGSYSKIEIKIPITKNGQFNAVGEFLKIWPVEKWYEQIGSFPLSYFSLQCTMNQTREY